MSAYDTNRWVTVRVVSAEGARVGFMPCPVCGAAILVDPDDSRNRVDQHREWHLASGVSISLIAGDNQ